MSILQNEILEEHFYIPEIEFPAECQIDGVAESCQVTAAKKAASASCRGSTKGRRARQTGATQGDSSRCALFVTSDHRIVSAEP
eukprot:764373-Hanusia_phi.AAC.1